MTKHRKPEPFEKLRFALSIDESEGVLSHVSTSGHIWAELKQHFNHGVSRSTHNAVAAYMPGISWYSKIGQHVQKLER